MLYGDKGWQQLAEATTREDLIAVSEYNLRAPSERRLSVDAPVPFLGAVMTAPVVLLLTHPALDNRVTPEDYFFRRCGWPFAALHPEAPAGLSEWWQYRLSALVDRFGAQHVANAVSAVFLTPWPSEAFDAGLRLPSRRRMLDLAASAVARDALIVMLRGGELWTEDAGVAALPATRYFTPRTWRTTRVSQENLGDAAWDAIHKRVEVHAWL